MNVPAQMPVVFEYDGGYPKLNYLRVSFSSLTTLDNSCARKFEFSKIYEHPREEKDLPAEVGIALHRGYQDWLINKDKEHAIWTMMANYPAELNNNPTDPRSMEACYATMMAMMDHAGLETMEIAQIKCLDGVTRHAIEVPFEIIVKGFSLDDRFDDKGNPAIPVSYIGYMDLIGFDRVSQEYSVGDIKTTRENLTDYSPRFEFDQQCLPAGLLLERILGHNIEAFDVKYIAAYVDVEKPKVLPYTFSKTKTDVIDWAQGLYMRLDRIKHFYQMQWFPRTMDGKSCQPFRNKRCLFFDACSSRNPKAIQNYILGGEAPKEKKDDWAPWIKIDLELV